MHINNASGLLFKIRDLSNLTIHYACTLTMQGIFPFKIRDLSNLAKFTAKSKH
jgi:hypothetical protein